jgi:hypothetical protein
MVSPKTFEGVGLKEILADMSIDSLAERLFNEGDRRTTGSNDLLDLGVKQ